MKKELDDWLFWLSWEIAVLFEAVKSVKLSNYIWESFWDRANLFLKVLSPRISEDLSNELELAPKVGKDFRLSI